MSALPFLTPKVIAEVYGFDISGVIRWCRTGRLRAYQAGGFRGAWRIPPDAWEEFFRANCPPVKLPRKPAAKLAGPSRQRAADRVLDRAGV